MQGETVTAFWPQFIQGSLWISAFAGIVALKLRRVRIIGPLRLLSRGIDYLRAAGFVTEIAVRKAAEVARDRWPEALWRARQER